MSIYELLERQEELLKEIELLCKRQNAAASKDKNTNDEIRRKLINR